MTDTGGAKKEHFVGIKGTGVCALAELYHRHGYAVSGSDTAEWFYTCDILRALGIPFYESFAEEHIPPDAALVIHSAAYTASGNKEIAHALRLNIPVQKYTDALGAYSARFFSAGISGVNGKTTVTALAGTIARALKLPAQILAGSAVSTFAGTDGQARSTLSLGDVFFIAETCEYRGHFLAFHPRVIVLTNIEHDHQDFFPTYESIRDMFVAYVNKLPEDGTLIYCADDPGARELVELTCGKKITRIPYGFSAEGDYRVTALFNEPEKIAWTLARFGEQRFTLRVPGHHNILNATAAAALCLTLAARQNSATGGQPFSPEQTLPALCAALEQFRGSKRRGEIIGEAGGILFMDDYGHHPSAIKTTLSGLKAFYPSRRLIVSFMPHTYTRTAALLADFAACFTDSDVLFLHKIYPSARETYAGGVSGITLYEQTRARHPNVHYIDDPYTAAAEIAPQLKPGDLFLTLGAGDNWKLGRRLYEQKRSAPCEA
jgi:UDP-N-acetylmuramate--alanine ligase